MFRWLRKRLSPGCSHCANSSVVNLIFVTSSTQSGGIEASRCSNSCVASISQLIFGKLFEQSDLWFLSFFQTDALKIEKTNSCLKVHSHYSVNRCSDNVVKKNSQPRCARLLTCHGLNLLSGNLNNIGTSLINIWRSTRMIPFPLKIRDGVH